VCTNILQEEVLSTFGDECDGNGIVLHDLCDLKRKSKSNIGQDCLHQQTWDGKDDQAVLHATEGIVDPENDS